MSLLRPFATLALVALAACGAEAEDPPVNLEIPAELRDLPFYAGIAGNDLVHGETLRQIARKAVDERNFAGLNNMRAYLRATESRLPGGTWELGNLSAGIEDALSYRPFDPTCELRGVDFTRAWAAHDPSQPGPYVAEAAMYLDYAWCLRGDDYARNVTAKQWEGFRTNADYAYQVLSSHEDVLENDPDYYVMLTRIAQAIGSRGPDVYDVLDDGSDIEPFYYGLYFGAVRNALPQWGGSTDDVDWIARYAARQTSDKDGESLYARVYWYVMDIDDITRFPVDRELLATAMDDVFERYPSDWNAANFARMACRLGERDLARRQFDRGGRSDGFEWDDRGEWMRCRQFAGFD